jgi:hypothetical protein
MSGYHSIFFEPDWAHTLYYGWRDLWVSPQLRVLEKRRGPTTRKLILSSNPGEADSRLQQALGHDALAAETVLHDFADALPIGSDRRFERFHPMPRHAWLFNGATFVIDLAQSEETLLQRMNPDTSRRIHKAQSAGVEVKIERRPSSARLDRFFDTLRQAALQRAFDIARAETLARMFDDGRAILVSNETHVGEGAYLMIYCAGDKGYWLHGAGRGTSPSAGQLLHWRAIQQLRNEGARWYDLGGVPSNPVNGIYKFKRAFGGEYLDLGCEYVSRTPLMKLLRAGAMAARSIRK